MRIRSNLLGILLLLVFGCAEKKQEEAPPPAPPLEPRKEVVVPKDFHGPIDPEWPPSHPADLAVELEASRLFRETVAARPKGLGKPVGKMSEDDTLGLYVERGKIGDFEYLEVIVGPLRDPDAPMPLVVFLHGRGGKARVPSAPFSSEKPFRMFIPQSPDKLGSGYTWLATWTNSGETQLLSRSISARADQLAPVIEAFRRSNPTIGKPILVGFSQGGILSFALTTRYPARFSAAFPMASWLPPALYPAPKKGQKFPYIYAQHGGADRTVPVEKGRETVRGLRARGLRVDYRELAGVGHIVTKGMETSMSQGVERILDALASAPRKSPQTRPSSQPSKATANGAPRQGSAQEKNSPQPSKR